MIVNANAFPGPALWQGVMLCLLPLLLWGLSWANKAPTWEGRRRRTILAFSYYAAFGVVLLLFFVWG